MFEIITIDRDRANRGENGERETLNVFVQFVRQNIIPPPSFSQSFSLPEDRFSIQPCCRSPLSSLSFCPLV